MDRSEKTELVSSLRGTFESTGIVVVAHYSGLTVADMNDLRTQMRTAGASFKVTKNRLTRLALEGTPYEPISDMFTGPTAIAYSDDPVGPAKGVANDSGSVTFEPSSTDISKVSCNLPASSSSALIVFVMSFTATFIFRPPAWMLYLHK